MLENNHQNLSMGRDEKHPTQKPNKNREGWLLIQKIRLQWLGHVERMSNERLQKKLLVSKIMNGKRCQGGQKQRWHDLIHADLKQLNMVVDWRTAARDRKQWCSNINKLLHDLNAQKELDKKARKDFAKIQKKNCQQSNLQHCYL